MKLFDRARMPLTAKLVPAANADWPLASWLTPAAESARLKTSRLLITGSSAIRFVSKRTPTSDVVVLRMDASEVTITVSATAPVCIVTSTTASWFTARVSPERTYFVNPASSTVSS